MGGIESNINRHFGGLNLLFSGEFWQLHPTGDVAVRTNPSTHPSNIMMAIFWEVQNIDWGLRCWRDSKSR
eukprot:2919896-Karenia_brevis.AAC.1